MSSGGYANRLSEYDDKGICGLPETLDSERTLKNKLAKLTNLVKEAKGNVVILTGAGVSTSAGIPDFRGPNGIWTVEEKEKKEQKRCSKTKRKKKGGKATTSSKKKGEKEEEDVTPADVKGEPNEEKKGEETSGAQSEKVSEFYNSPKKSPTLKRKRDGAIETDEKGRDDSSESAEQRAASFEKCRPTLTHRAITKLASLGIVKYCITQNVDGLHRRSGLPRSKHAVLHGCVFTEKCEKCGEEYFRDFDLGGVSFKKTGRKCTATAGCGGDLRDTILDWEDPLPEEDWERAQDECEDADLVISLGTSLRIEPAGSLPTSARRFVIVNLQVTPYDNDACLIIRAKVDEVMTALMTSLNIEGWDDTGDTDQGQNVLEYQFAGAARA